MFPVTPRRPRSRVAILSLIALSLMLTGALSWLTFGSASAAFNGKDNRFSTNSIGERLAHLANNSAMAKYFGGFSMMQQQAPSCTPPPSGLVAWYPGDGNANDIQGGNNGALQGGATYAPGKVGQAFSLNGTDAFVQAPNNSATDPTAAGSQDAWVMFNQLPSSAGHIMEIIGKGSSGNDFDLQADTDNHFRFYIAAGNNVASSTVIQTGVWYHIAGTWDATGLRLYVNGVLENTNGIQNLTRGQSGQPLQIGNQPFFGPRLFNGLIDEATIYNRALSQTEIQAIVTADSAGKCKPPPPSCVTPPANMVAWYPEDGNTDDIKGGYNPSATNAISFVPAKVGQGVTFGSGGYIDIPDSPNLDLQTLTLDAWARPDGNDVNRDGSIIVEKDINVFQGNQTSYGLSWNVGIGNRFVLGINGNFISSTNTFQTGQFYHVAGTYDGSVMKLYVNGVLEAQQSLVTTISYDTSVPLTIGANPAVFRNSGFLRTWSGVIDEVDIFNRALSQTEIQSIVNAGSAGKCKPQAGGATLGNYANTSVQLGGDATITPDAAPTNAARITVSTSTNFKGTLQADPTTGVVRVTNANPAGTYTVTVRAFSGGTTTTKTFTLTVTTPATCSTVTFAAATNYSLASNDNARSVAVGDFNNDGKQDLVIANFTTNNVSVLLGDGNGGFGARTDFGAGSGPFSVAVGDFNGDGNQDLAIANVNSANVSILLNNGTGGFLAASNYGVGLQPYSVAVGDFNNDGKLDLVTSNVNSADLSVLLGVGDGSFGTKTDFATGGNNPQSVVVGDFNGDGTQDLAVANTNSSNVSVLLGNGTGGFGVAVNYLVGTSPYQVVIGDFNNDGKQDLATVNDSSNNVSILLNDGAGGFGTKTDFPVSGGAPFSIAVGDFDGNGNQDLVVGNFSTSNVSVLLGNGAGSFSAATNFSLGAPGAQPYSVAVGDFNGDGKQDIVTANANTDNVSVLLRQCPPPPPPPLTEGPSCVTSPAGLGDSYPGEGNASDILGDNNGTASGGVTYAPGKVRQAFTFDGSGSVNFGNTVGQFGTRDFSVDFWMQTTSTVQHEVMGNRTTSSNGTFFGIRQKGSGGLTVEVDNGGDQGGYIAIDSLTAINDGVFHHIAVVRQGTTLSLYIDGNLNVSGSNSQGVVANIVNGSSFIVGAGCCQAPFSGQLDEIHIYNSALSQSNVQSIFNAGSAGVCPPVTYTVTTNADVDNGGVCGATCSLRDAINAANAHPGVDKIAFNISGSGVQTINLTAALPTITDPVIINGYTQPNTSVNTFNINNGDNAALQIELNGASAGSATDGLTITAGNSTVRGLVFNRFGGNAIRLQSNGNTIAGNFIGTNAYGTNRAALDNSRGVFLDHASNNFIGGDYTNTAARNIISGNYYQGIYGDSASGNTIQGNYIGLSASGTDGIGNGVYGIYFQSGNNNVIGGTTGSAGNVISGNGNGGIRLGQRDGFGGNYASSGNTIQGNLIGVAADGTAAQGNNGDGISTIYQSNGNTIGGTSEGAGNVIAYSNGNGVSIFDGVNNAVLGNSIFSNRGLGIDLGQGNSGGVTLNDAGDADTGSNNLQNFPVITSASFSSSNRVTTIQGTLNSTPNTIFRVELFVSLASNPSDYGEGQYFIGSINATTDANGNASFSTVSTTPNQQYKYITATATDPAGNTSEFSQDVLLVAEPQPQTYTVVNTADSGAGSLRQAIIDANANSGTDTIAFNLPSGAQTITLQSGELAITDSVNIVGTGANSLTISGNNNSRVFSIGDGTNVTISGLTITGGNGLGAVSSNLGGGVYVGMGATLNLTNASVSNNSNSTVSNGAGAGIFIDSNATANITNCTISNNVNNFQGGGIYNGGGTLNITGSTISSNTTPNNGGGVYARETNISSAVTTVTNSTISGNTAYNGSGGGIFNYSDTANNSTLNLTNTTVAFNNAGNVGGGLFNQRDTVNVKDTIIADNTGNSPDVFGAITSQGYNLIGDATGSTGFGQAGDKAGTSTAPINPQLGALADNGGPTQTHALLQGSPAVDAGNSSLTIDQRGLTRPIDIASVANANNGSDIGAFEAQSLSAQTYMISGTVYDDQHNPVPNAYIYLSGDVYNSVVTDSAGQYSFTNLAAGGTYYIQPNSTCRDYFAYQTFSNLSSNQTADFTGTLNLDSISGRVVESNGVGISDVTVTLVGNGGQTVQNTDANGNFSFYPVQAGSDYTLTASKNGFTITPPSQTFTNLCGSPYVTFTGMLPPPAQIANNYIISQSTNGTIVPGTTDIGNHCDDCSTPITLPFNYTLYDRAFSTAQINSNGVVHFGSNSGAYSNNCLPTYSDFDYSILGYWDDLRTDGSSSAGTNGVFTSVSGTAPNRIFNIEWRSSYYNNRSQSINFEIRLYEGQQRYDVIYNTVDQSGNSGTVGVQRTSTSVATQYECNTGGLTPGLMLSFAASDATSISGSVLDANGAGISGVTVTLSGGNQPLTANTDASGYYTFINPVTGVNYTVTPSRQNYTFSPASISFPNFSGNQRGDFRGTPSTNPTYTISGVVIDSANTSPLSGVTVSLGGPQTGSATTDSNGAYSFTVNAGGNYSVTPTKANYTFNPPSATFSNLSDNQTANFIGTAPATPTPTPTPALTFTIAGRVADTNGAGLGNVVVTLNNGSQSVTNTTDANGNYSFGNLAQGGNYTVTPSQANYTFTPTSRAFNSLSSNQTADFNAALRTYAISGQVTGGGTAFSGVTVTLTGSSASTTSTDANGNYSFTVNVGGSYTVTPSDTALYSFTSQSVANLSGNQTLNFNGTLRVYAINGRVVDESGGGVTGVAVTLTGSTQSNSVITGDDGSFSFQNVAAGANYTVTPSKQNYIFAPPSQTVSNLSSNQTINFTGSLRASVQTPTGTNVSSQAGPASLTFANVTQAGMTTVTTINPASAGTPPSGYTPIAAPAFDLSTTAQVSGQITTCFQVSSISDPAQFNALRVLHGENGNLVDRTSSRDFSTRTICSTQSSLSPFVVAQLTGAPVFAISGQITDTSGAPLGGVGLTLTGSQTGTSVTDANGNYSFINLAQGGNYTITPSKANFVFSPVQQSFNNLAASQTFNFRGAQASFTISGHVIDTSNGAGLAGATVILGGAGSATATTDANGNYAFNNIAANGSYTVTPSKASYIFNPAQLPFGNLAANQTANFAGTLQPTATPTPPPSSSDFSGPLDPAVFTTGTLTNNAAAFNPNITVQTANGNLEITTPPGATGFNGIVTANPLDFTMTPSLSVEIVQTTTGDGSQTIFAAGNDSNNFYRFVVSNSDDTSSVQSSSNSKDSARLKDNGTTSTQTLSFQTSVNGTKFSIGIPYNPTQHRFWRLRYEAVEQTMNFETSPDAKLWKLQFSARVTTSVTSLAAELSAGTTKGNVNPGKAIFDNLSVSALTTIQFSSPAYSIIENGGNAQITVTRSGNTESASSIDYATSNGTATAGSDYIATNGTLRFNAGEITKTFNVPVTDDNVVEADEIVNLTLGNPIGAALGTPNRATLTIIDNDTRPTNPLDEARFFVRQQYLDFLNREPDQGGFDYWVGRIAECGSDQKCINARRIDVSAAFFIEQEFQDTGSFVYRMYKASFGRRPAFAQFTADRSRIIGGANLDASKQAFAEEWTNRPEFKNAYDKLTDAQYVDALYANEGVKLGQEDRTTSIIGLLTKRQTRTDVLLEAIANDQFKQKEYNQAFVLMQYFGYLRRDPDEAGYQFWLDVLNNKVPGNYRSMVCAFISSAEYQFRFGSVRTHTDADCSGK